MIYIETTQIDTHSIPSISGVCTSWARIPNWTQLCLQLLPSQHRRRPKARLCGRRGSVLTAGGRRSNAIKLSHHVEDAHSKSYPSTPVVLSKDHTQHSPNRAKRFPPELALLKSASMKTTRLPRPVPPSDLPTLSSLLRSTLLSRRCLAWTRCWSPC